MAYGVFEAAVGSEHEVGLARQASIDSKAAAVYDVREKLGPVLFASRDLEEFRHKVAMMKADQSVYKIISAHLMPLPKVIRSIVGKNSALENEFLQRLADSGAGAYVNDMSGAMGTSPPNTPNTGVGDPTGGLLGETVQPGTHPGPQGITGMPTTTGGPGTTPSSASAPMLPTAMRKGAPFAGYEDFDDCTSKNSDKGRPDAYCGEIKHRTEDKKGNRTAVYDTIDHPKWDNGTVDTNETFEGGKTDTELKPKGDFKGYLNKVDQGAPGKIKRNFSGEGTEHTEDPAKHNFASRKTVGIYATFCKRRGLSPIRLSSLDRFAQATTLTDAGYFRLATTIQAWENDHKPTVPSTKLKKKDKVAAGRYVNDDHALRATDNATGHREQTVNPYTGEAGNRPAIRSENTGYQQFSSEPYWEPPAPGGKHRAEAAMRHYKTWCRRYGLRMLSARNINHYAQGDPELAYFLAMRCKEAIKMARRRQGGRRTAAPDYLQKADDALTQLLNQKAEEFQETIQPLQQALITVQQAEQLQQQQNPLNVLPPPGTVNVMPGQEQSPAAQLGMPDPNAPDLSGLVQMLGQPGGGGAQTGLPPAGGQGGDQGPPPAATGGGLPPDLDQQAQKAAGRGKGRGAFRPRQAGGVGELWDRWKQNRSEQGDALRGDEVDYSRFQNEHGVGERAMQNLRQRNQTPDYAPVNGVGRGRSPGTTVGRRHQADDSMMPGMNQFPGSPTSPTGPNPAGGNPVGSPGSSTPSHLGLPAPTPGTVVSRRRQACWPGCHENEAHAAKFHNKDKKESRRRQSAPQYDTFNAPAAGSPQAEYQHPGVAKGWKGQFAQEPQGPYDGEYYTKGPASVRGGPGPDTSKYWATTPHGMSGPHTNVHDAFDSAEPFLQQHAQIGQGQGTLFPPPSNPAPRARGAARPRVPLARQRRAETYSGEGEVKKKSGPFAGSGGSFPVGTKEDLDDAKNVCNFPSVKGKHPGTCSDVESMSSPKKAASRKQAWTGWGPAVFPKVRKVAGWDWNEHLNGYLSNKPQHFACECGEQFPAPSGFNRCACGRQWNSYVIGTGGSNKEASAEKFIVREVPVRPDVIVANRKLAVNAQDSFSEWFQQQPMERRKSFDDAAEKGRHQKLPSTALRPSNGEPPAHPRTPMHPDLKVDIPNRNYGEYMGKDPYQHKSDMLEARGFRSTEHTRATHPDRVPEGVASESFYKRPNGGVVIDQSQDLSGNHWARRKAVQLVDRYGNIHNLIDPGELGEGDDPGHSTFRTPPKDWARRGDGAKWTKNPIG